MALSLLGHRFYLSSESVILPGGWHEICTPLLKLWPHKVIEGLAVQREQSLKGVK